MSNNIETERSVTGGKMYPIDLAPQKITIVKNIANTEVKMAHLIPGQPKTSGSGQIITHTGPVGLMRPAAQIFSTSVASQPQMIASGSPILQANQIVNQGSQMIGQSTQIISQSQLISPSGQLISPATQIISQGSQLSGQVSSSNTGNSNIQTCVSSSVSGPQVLNVGGQLVGGSGNLVVSSSVRTLPPSVRVLSPLPHHNTRPVLSSVNVTNTSGVLVNKSVGMTSHVPRGLAAGASLAVRPVTPTASQGVGGQGAWSTGNRGARGALVYGARTPVPRATASRPTTPTATGLAVAPTPLAIPQASLSASQAPHSAVVSLPSSTVLSTSGVISGGVRGVAPRLQSPAPIVTPSAPRPLPLLQRNYQPKVVGVASVGVRGVVGNSAPAQLYYEVPRAAAPPAPPPSRPLTPYAQSQPVQVNAVNTLTVLPESRPPPTSVQTTPVVPRPSILRKRDIEGSPTKAVQPAPQTISVSQVGSSGSVGQVGSLGTVGQVGQLASLGQVTSMGQGGTLGTVSQVGTLGQVGSLGSIGSLGQVGSIGSLGQVGSMGSLGQVGSIASLGQVGSIGSLGQVGSMGSLGQVGSIGSLGQVGSIGSLGQVGSIGPLGQVGSIGVSVSAPIVYTRESTGWEDVPTTEGPRSGGSTTISASSSPAPDDEPEPPRIEDVSPRKKPRKQMLTNEVRQCDYTPEEAPPTPPPVAAANPPPKRPQLSSSYVCGWRSTALHFTRPADVRRREPRAKDILAIASQKHVLTSAEGWKVHHLTAQMDDLVSLEADVGEQLASILRAIETTSGRAFTALQPHSHTLLELLKGNIQRSKIVCEGIQEAREDILRVFTHRNFVSEILTRQADKRCFRKHRSQS